MRIDGLEDTLSKIETQVRRAPADPKLRVHLFQLLCVLGRWERALTQLRVSAELDPANLVMATLCEAALQCEALREQIFAGARTPLILGEPEEWISLIVQANNLFAKGQYEAGRDLTARAFETAPATPGEIDGKPFGWIADADPRLGPILEAIIDGKYYWVPFARVGRIEITPPVDLRDVVWLPAVFTWSNGGQSHGLILARYPGSHASRDDSIRMARKTEWIKLDEETYKGLGQRMLITDAGEYPLLDVRRIALKGSEVQ